MDNSQINAAVCECVTRCKKTSQHRAYIAEFVHNLQERRGWDQADAEVVGRGAIQAINQCAGKSQAKDFR